MCDDEDDELWRYFFGDLSCAERADFEKRLANEPELAKRFEKYTQCCAALRDANCGDESNVEEVPVPRNLGLRTAQAILTDHIERASECVGRKRFNFVEIVAVGVAATFLGGLILPAIQASRVSAQRLTCEANLSNIGQALQQYANTKGHFPRIGPTQNAGLFAVLLADGDYLESDVLQKSLICPSSSLSEQLAGGKLKVFVPTPDKLEAASDAQLEKFRQLMAVSYAYRLGYFNGDKYIPFNGANCCRSAILADSPSLTGGAQVVSRHHGDCGQNVLFEDGHVVFVSGCWAPDDVDHLFLNDDNELAAGRNNSDIVLAPSGMTPLGKQAAK